HTRTHTHTQTHTRTYKHTHAHTYKHTHTHTHTRTHSHSHAPTQALYALCFCPNMINFDFYLCRVDSCILQTIWTAALGFENQKHCTDLLNAFGPELHLPVWETSMFERAGEVIRQRPEKIRLILHLDPARQPLSEAAYKLVLSLLPHLSSVRYF